MYFSARADGRISYGHLGRTNSCFKSIILMGIGVGRTGNSGNGNGNENEILNITDTEIGILGTARAGADAVLKLRGGGHRRKIVFSMPPKFASSLQFRGHSGGIPQWKKIDIVKITSFAYSDYNIK